MNRRWNSRTWSAALAALLVLVGFGLAAEAGAKPIKRTCGLLPGEGAYNYIKTQGVECRAGGKIAFRARMKFCNRHNDCLSQGATATTRVYKGRVRYRGWSCRVKVGWEDLYTRCSKGNRWIMKAAAS